jgi:hypothetical protein
MMIYDDILRYERFLYETFLIEKIRELLLYFMITEKNEIIILKNNNLRLFML